MAAAADNRRSTKGETLQTRHPNSGHPKSKTCTKYCRNHEAGDGRKSIHRKAQPRRQSIRQSRNGGKASAKLEVTMGGKASTKQHEHSGNASARANEPPSASKSRHRTKTAKHPPRPRLPGRQCKWSEAGMQDEPPIRRLAMGVRPGNGANK